MPGRINSMPGTLPQAITGVITQDRDEDGDGIGDTAYIINHRTNSIDYRPLMNFTPELKVLPEAIFTSNVTVGYAPLTVEFIDFSENASSLLWDLGNLRTSELFWLFAYFR